MQRFCERFGAVACRLWDSVSADAGGRTRMPGPAPAAAAFAREAPVPQRRRRNV
ncbi:hypothetical protein ACFOPN_18855 [Xanthomonas hyacinthi]|uniref:hypothetical protein n=1 Tax=Xanthomonas hyacinthi TaxID=56455 RepID=UPI003606E03F